jgi:hypothetical protein
LHKAIKAGKLSITTDKTIDPAEMLRVFGEPRPASVAPPEPPKTTPDTSALEAELAGLKAENAGLKATVAAIEAHNESLKQALLMLGHDRPRSRWWPWGKT